MQNHCCTRDQGRDRMDVQTTNMKQRQHIQHNIRRLQTVGMLAHSGIAAHRTLWQHRPLWPSCCTGGVNDQQRCLGCIRCVIGHHGCDATVCTGAVKTVNWLSDHCRVRPGQRVDASGKFGPINKYFWRTVTKLIGKLGSRQPPIQWHHDDAGTRRCQQQNKILRMVHAVAGEAITLCKMGSHPVRRHINQSGKCRIAQAITLKDQRRLVRRQLRVAEDGMIQPPGHSIQPCVSHFPRHQPSSLSPAS